MGCWGKVSCVAGFLAALMPTNVGAQDQRPLTQAEQQDWPAIGLVFYGAQPKGAVCTGTLVAPDLVLTAGHCVDASGEIAALTFAAGWRQGAFVVIRKARGVVLADPADAKARTLADDLALIVLDTPISKAVIAPLPLLASGSLAETYSFIGYRRAAPGIIGRDDACALQGQQPGVLLLGCRAVSGNSGGPLLVYQRGRWQVAAVMVAQAHGDGQVQSFAALPGDVLRARIKAR